MENQSPNSKLQFFSITGDLDNRDLMQADLPKKGFIFSNDVNKKISFLVVGDKPKQGKINEARLNNIPLVTTQYIIDVLSGKEKHFDDYCISEQKKRKRNSLESIAPLLFRRKSTSSIIKSEDSLRSEMMGSRSFSSSSIKNKKLATETPKSRVIALEGQIGAGKSTLCNKFERSFPEICSAYKEQTNELFLKLFYSDPKKYGFAFQWGMLKSRIYQLQLAQHDAKTPENPPKQFYFWDRSMLGDYMFALWNHLLGGISREEMNVYESEFGGSIKGLSKISFLKDINCFVLLNDEPAQCKFRVEQHRKNESEQGIPLPYYEGIDDMHFNIFMKLLKEKVGPVVIFNWGEYHDTNNTLTIIKEVMSGKRANSIVKDISFEELSTVSKSDSFVYTRSKEIKDNYSELVEMGDIQSLKDVKNIYIPKDIMRISNTDKGIIPNDYQLDFYRNEYKRIVLYHLSRFQNVYFYQNPSDSDS